jgi:predicted acyltransferase
VTDRTVPSSSGRIASLDQFRGYTVAGMLLVNFVGGYAVVPKVLQHHNTYCSYADTIMPQFFFAVGFAYRMTFLRRLGTVGARAASLAVLRRCVGLALIGFAVYHLDGGVQSWSELQALGPAGFFKTAFQREFFQTLVHIAVTTVWILPVIGARPRVRVEFLVASAVLHVALSHWFYLDFAWNRPVIDGGPLGFLSWTIPTLVGSLAYDAVARAGAGAGWGVVAKLAGWSVVLMLAGYGLSCLGGELAAPPFVPPLVATDGPVGLWTMSQRTGSVSYLTFGAGFSLAVYGLFLALCDLPGAGRGLDVGLFRSFGRNALVAYVMHSLVADAVKPYVPRDVPAWYLAAGFALYFAITYGFVRGLEKDRVFVKF